MNNPVHLQDLKHIRVERDNENVAWLHLDQADSNVNVLTTEMFVELDTALDSIFSDPPTGLVLVSDKPSGFIVGADVKAFTRIDTTAQVNEIIQTGQSMFNRIEQLPVPTVALIHGFCLGGGLELALACNYRIGCGDEPARLGLPEVLLGIHPGFGGTVRLIRLIGVLSAMQLMLSGKTVDVFGAKKLGIIDESVPRRHMYSAASRRIREKPAGARASRGLRLLNNAVFRPLIAAILRHKTARRIEQQHYPAPFSLIDLWRKHGANEAAMMAGEAESIGRLFMHPAAKRLVHVFLLQERLKGLGTQQKDFSVRHVHVIGAGVMGGDIAAWCAYKGMRVTLQDREPEYIGPAIRRAHELYQRRIRDRYSRQQAADRLVPDHKGYGVEHADVVIEAIIEDPDAKIALYRDLYPRLKQNALLATNTSSIPLQQLAAYLDDPGRLIGIHFFNPVAKMQLVEVVSADMTDPARIEHGIRFIRAIDRLPLPVKSAPGFLVNRVLLPYLLEAMQLLDEGVPAAVIDKEATRFGMPMGPIALADAVGLDICHSVANILADTLGVKVPDVLGKFVDQGHLGKKTGQGIYKYKDGKQIREKIRDTSSVPTEDIQQRLILRLLNECVACLREGIVDDGELLDAGLVFGAGFAPFRGGPMYYLHDCGIGDTRLLLEDYEQRYGERFHPDPGWEGLHGLL